MEYVGFLYYRNRNCDFKYIPSIWVLGPLGKAHFILKRRGRHQSCPFTGLAKTNRQTGLGRGGLLQELNQRLGLSILLEMGRKGQVAPIACQPQGVWASFVEIYNEQLLGQPL